MYKLVSGNCLRILIKYSPIILKERSIVPLKKDIRVASDVQPGN